MVELRRILLKDLLKFSLSEEYQAFPQKPISSLRLNSYLNNPHADSRDPVMFLLYVDKVMVAYRTVLIDKLITNTSSIKFIWLSGSWVHPNYRRKGYSTNLVFDIIEAWDSKVLYANYAPSSKMLFDKTGEFRKLTSLKGKRFYRKLSLSEILPPRSKLFQKIKPFLIIADTVTNAFRSRMPRRTGTLTSAFTIHQVNAFSEKEIKFVKKNFLGKRLRVAENILNWIINYPWASNDSKFQEEQNHYQFTLYRSDFSSTIYSIRDSSDSIIGIIWLIIVNGKMKIPLCIFNNEARETALNLILHKIKEFDITHLTLFDENLISYFRKKNIFLYSKNFDHHIFIHKGFEPKNALNEIVFTYFDGDVIFT